jgi:hypothetical protein
VRRDDMGPIRRVASERRVQLLHQILIWGRRAGLLHGFGKSGLYNTGLLESMGKGPRWD